MAFGTALAFTLGVTQEGTVVRDHQRHAVGLSHWGGVTGQRRGHRPVHGGLWRYVQRDDRGGLVYSESKGKFRST